MYQLIPTTRFKKNLKRIKPREKDFEMVKETLKILQVYGVNRMAKTMKPHGLKGDYADNWECHLKPDLLIIWIQIESPRKIKLVRLGSHSELFK